MRRTSVTLRRNHNSISNAADIVRDTGWVRNRTLSNTRVCIRYTQTRPTRLLIIKIAFKIRENRSKREN